MTSGVDTVAIMKKDRSRSDAVLNISGKDIENDIDVSIDFDKASGIWKLLGKAEDYRISTERQEILDVLAKSKEPLGPKDISLILTKNYDAIKVLLYKMSSDGVVKTIGRGKYVINR
jgi:hypothetical protein